MHEAPRPLPPPDPGAGSRGAGRPFLVFLTPFVLFTLGNSSDAFLLLRLNEAGLPAGAVALVWSAFHAVKAAATYGGGRLSDRIGRRPMVLAGWAVYAAVYAGFALLDGATALVAVFLAYGLFFGLTEPVEKAWIAAVAPAGRRGAAFGLYHAALGLTALPASLLFGLLWQAFGVAAAFLTGAGLALAAAALLLAVTWRK